MAGLGAGVCVCVRARARARLRNCFASLNSVSKMQVNSSLFTIEFVLDFGGCSGFCDPLLMFSKDCTYDISSLGSLFPPH